MILPDATPDDFVNHHLQSEARRLQEQGDGFAAWHGRDTFTGEDAELLINLDNHTGFLSLGHQGDRGVFTGRLTEDGEHVTLIFAKAAQGQVVIDLDSETLDMNAHRIGVDYAPGEDPKLRLYDKLTGDTILETAGDEFHELVDERKLDPKDYPGSGLLYARNLGLV